MKRTTKIPTDRWEALRYSLPYLIFVLIPVWDIVETGVWVPAGYLSLGLLAAMVALYIYLWIENPLAPVGHDVGLKFWIPFLLLMLVLATVTLLGGGMYPGLVFMWTYAAPPWVLLGPKQWLPGGSLLLAALAAGLSIAVRIPLYLLFPAGLALVLTDGMVLIVRREAEKSRVEDGRRVAEHQLELERERTQMNADLHDILGQDLTGMSIKADLAVRLLEEGKEVEASAEMQSVANLARAALDNVRSVVRSRREWSVDHELANVEDLLAARGITLHLDRQNTAFPGKVQGAVARVIRESITNLLRHAEAANCWIALSPTRLSIRNDGYEGGPVAADNEHAVNGGLNELRQRVSESGQLVWHQDGTFWTVTFDVAADAAPSDSPLASSSERHNSDSEKLAEEKLAEKKATEEKLAEKTYGSANR